MLKKKYIKKEINDGMELCDCEPDGRELADFLRNQEEWIKENPDLNMDDIADYYADLEDEIKRGK